MVQPKEMDFEEEIEDAQCDCEVCQAAAAEAEDVEEIVVDRISDDEWAIYDFSGTDPAAYLLTATPIAASPFSNLNFTLVECDIDNFEKEFEEYQVFIREVWSSDVYVSGDKSYDILSDGIVSVIPRVKLSNPIELAYLFGGSVNNKKVQMPKVPRSN